MKKKIKIRTSTGWKGYNISHSQSTYYCYRESGWSDTRIGEARSMDDAITLIKVDAKQFGEVREIKM